VTGGRVVPAVGAALGALAVAGLTAWSPLAGGLGAVFVAVVAAGWALSADPPAPEPLEPPEDDASDRITEVAPQVYDALERQPMDPLEQLPDAVSELAEAYSRMRRHVSRNEGLQREMLANVPGGVVLVGADGRVRVLNDTVRELLPVVPVPFGKQVDQAVPFAPLAEAIEQAMATGETVSREGRSGRFDLLIRAVPLTAGGAIAAMADVTSIQQAARARSDFVANVSHELRTPVTSILGYSETLLSMSADLDDDRRFMLEAVDRNAKRLVTIFEELLDLARTEASGGALELEDHALAPLVALVTEQYADVAGAKKVELVVDVDPALRALVHPKAVDRILANLVANALKYAPDKSWIRIEGRMDGAWTVIDVRDHGPGIDPALHDRIFERFYRVDRGRSRDAGGTGLGLALVKHLCAATQARVSVRSNPGHGATFSVRFPASLDDA
jgi:two-component system phosphate regulon sensor histidine kinase PhoR